MCFGKGPSIPESKAPKLLPQPIARVEPAGLKVGRNEDEDGANKAQKLAKARGKLRLRKGRDKVSTQVAGASIGGAGGTQV